VAADGRREVLAFAVHDSEDGAFWTGSFWCELRGSVGRRGIS
jgi:transposase-like protein